MLISRIHLRNSLIRSSYRYFKGYIYSFNCKSVFTSNNNRVYSNYTMESEKVIENDQLHQFDETKYIKIVEGSASMIYDKNEEVFYNKVQVFNRDISIQVIRLFASKIQQERDQIYQKKISRRSNTTEKYKYDIYPPKQGIYFKFYDDI